jgi:hypothetical protein
MDIKPRAPSLPASASCRTRAPIIELRLQLTKVGFDAGQATIAWPLEHEGHRPPSTSTISRILHTANLVVPEPRNRPRTSCHASLPLNPTKPSFP